MDESSDFRDLVQAWLDRRGWSQARLAEATEVSQSLISKHLTADPHKRVNPSPANLERIAASSGVDDAYPHRLRHSFASHYLTVHPGDEIGLRRIIGHVSKAVLEDYVHLAQSTIAHRAGQASIAESLLG